MVLVAGLVHVGDAPLGGSLRASQAVGPALPAAGQPHPQARGPGESPQARGCIALQDLVWSWYHLVSSFVSVCFLEVID